MKYLQGCTFRGCNTYIVTALYITGCLISLVSFCNVLAVGIHRFQVIHLHLRYQELVTHKRVIAVVILMWVLILLHDK